MQVRFPNGIACFLCFAPYGPPFNHEIPPSGIRYKGTLCDYPDCLKELAYMIYGNEQVRDAVFTRLGRPVPATLTSYWRFIGAAPTGGLLGVYHAIAAYLDLREMGGFENNTGH
jgi:hypothetical protein